jgi:hypothetical protein
MTLPASDNFTAAANAGLAAYSANWTVNAGTFAVNAAGDYVQCDYANAYAVARWNADAFGADQFSEVKVSLRTGAAAACDWIGPAVRIHATANTYYGVFASSNFGTNSIYLSKLVAGSLTDLAFVDGLAVAAGDVLRLEVTGSSLTVKRNGVAIAGLTNITDASIAAGSAGICGYGEPADTVSWMDDWQGGNLGAAGVSGAAAVTLGGLTAAGTGGVRSAGSAAATLGALTAAGAGASAGGSAGGAASITLAGAASAGAGVVSIQGAGGGALGAVSAGGAGGVRVAGAGGGALASLAAAGAGYGLAGACVGGVLTVDPTNGRYFRNAAGPLVLAGFHTWASIQDSWPGLPITPLDFDEYLAALVGHGCNFTKAWFLESARNWGDSAQYFAPHPWPRTGPGNAADGLPKFDLSQFNEAYFARLRERVIRLGNAGVYVCVQLFQGWHVALKAGSFDPWAYHPFADGNNVNSIDGDGNNDGAGYETRSTANAAVYAIQQAYVAKVLDTLNDLDNVLYEIANEEDSTSLPWQRALVDYVQGYEAGKAKQHPVGMTVCWPGGNNGDLYAAPAIDWLSPNGDYTPDAASTAKVSAFDTDHITGLTAEYKWIFRALCQGHNPWYMDEWAGETYGNDTRASATYQRIRANLGYALSVAAQIDLANAAPQPALASTGYCLAKTSGRAQLVAYQDGSGSFTVNLASLPGVFALTWLRTLDGATSAGSNVSGGAVRTLTPPWAGEDAVALLTAAGTDGAGGASLDGLTAQGGAAVAVRGALTGALAALGATAGAGAVSVAGAAAAALGDLAGSGAGAAAIQGAGGATLAALAAAGAAAVGDLPILGGAVVDLAALSADGAGGAAVAGAGAGALDGLALAALGSASIQGSGGAALDDLGAVGAGVSGEYVFTTGAAAITLGAVGAVGVGLVVTAIVVVWGSVTGPAAAGSATGPRANSTLGR